MPAKKKTHSSKAAAKEAASSPSKTEENGTKSSSSRPKASDLLKRTRHHTPAIFKVSSRKQAPIVFSLEDVREILKKRKPEQEADSGTSVSKPVAKKEPEPSTKVADDLAPKAGKHGAASLADILGFGLTPSAKPKADRTVPQKHEKYYKLLIELRDHVKQSLGMHAEDTLKRSQKEDSGDISTSADAGTDNFDRDFALSVVSSEQEALREIESAISRIYNGSYGICEITGDTISEERLEAVPFTRYSLEGQRQMESTTRRRVQRSGSFINDPSSDTISYSDDDGDN